MAIVRPAGRRRARPASRSRSNPLPSGAGCSPCPLRSRQSAANPESASLAAKPSICSLQPPYPCASTAPALAFGGARRYAGTRCPSSDTRSSSLMNSVGIWPPPATGRTVVVSVPKPVIDSSLGLVQSLLRASLREGKRLSGYQMAEVQVNKADGVLVGEAGSPSSSLSGRRTVKTNSM